MLNILTFQMLFSNPNIRAQYLGIKLIDLFWLMLVFLLIWLVEFTELFLCIVLVSMNLSKNAWSTLRKNTRLLHPFGRSSQYCLSIAAEPIIGCWSRKSQEKPRKRWRKWPRNTTKGSKNRPKTRKIWNMKWKNLSNTTNNWPRTETTNASSDSSSRKSTCRTQRTTKKKCSSVSSSSLSSITCTPLIEILKPSSKEPGRTCKRHWMRRLFIRISLITRLMKLLSWRLRILNSQVRL